MMASALATTASTATATATTAASPRIAVIGAGAAGLAAARVISRDTGWAPTVLEKDVQLGGVWRYGPKDKDNNNGKDDDEYRPMYRGLRTNLPKELMAFREFPFSKHVQDSFVTHKQVQEYLLDYQSHFRLDKYIRLGCPVQHLKILNTADENDKEESASRISPNDESWPTIQLDWKDTATKQLHSQTFDAVLICNGHYAAPLTPSVPGLEHFRGKTILHSIQYDDPAEYKGQTVLCIGGRASGADLAREISHHAQHVYLSDSTCTQAQRIMKDDDDDDSNSKVSKVTLVPKTTHIEPNGEIRFDYDCPIRPTNVDTILFCSGYDYLFPFIDESSSNLDLKVLPGERRVSPLFQQLWHAQYPSLAFCGLPHSVVPFPLFELQVEAVCAQWTKSDGRSSLSSSAALSSLPLLPPLEQRLASAHDDATGGGPKQSTTSGGGGRVPQDTHFLGDFQWDYCRDMARWAGRGDDADADDDLEGYIRTNQEIYNHAGQARKACAPGGPDSYRSIRYERPQWDQWKVLVGGGEEEEGESTAARDSTSMMVNNNAQ
jgi:hypothetical protein